MASSLEIFAGHFLGRSLTQAGGDGKAPDLRREAVDFRERVAAHLDSFVSPSA